MLSDECGGRPRDRDDVNDHGAGPPGPAVGVHATDEYHVVASDAAVDHQTSSDDNEASGGCGSAMDTVVGRGRMHVRIPKLASLVVGAAVGADAVEALVSRYRPTPRALVKGREKRRSGGRCMVLAIPGQGQGGRPKGATRCSSSKIQRNGLARINQVETTERGYTMA